MLILTNEHFARLWPTWWGLLYNLQIRTKQQLSQNQRLVVEVGLGLRLIMASIVLALLLLVRFVWLWPQTNQLTAINLTSVASMEGLSRVSLDYLTFNF